MDQCNEFTVGSIVMLKSGGPKMTVIGIENDGSLDAHWFTDNQKLKQARFLCSSLSAVEPISITAALEAAKARIVKS